MRARLLNLIPTHMRHRQIVRKTLHPSAQQPQSQSSAKLFRLFKQQLHAHANAEQRSSLGDALDDKAIEATLRESLHASAECADAWQDQGLCFAENVRVIADNCLRPGRCECLLERAQIAYAIINNCYARHNASSIPLTPLAALSCLDVLLDTVERV